MIISTLLQLGICAFGIISAEKCLPQQSFKIYIIGYTIVFIMPHLFGGSASGM